MDQAIISAPNTAYRDLLTFILNHGKRAEIKHMKTWTLRVLGYQMRFRPAEGFPLITERDLLSGKNPVATKALGELCAFLSGARTQAEFEKFGCDWWKSWVTAEKCAACDLPAGDLGPGSYGPAWRSFPTVSGVPLDQFSVILQQMRENPNMRTHRITNWIPQYNIRATGYTRWAVVAPCHGELYFSIDTDAETIDMVHKQRSADVPVGLAFNMVQYGALLLVVAQALGYKPGELVYWIDDAHIYEEQVSHVERMLATEPQPLPTVTLDPNVKDVFAFRPEHLQFHGYKPQLPFFRIPAPV